MSPPTSFSFPACGSCPLLFSGRPEQCVSCVERSVPFTTGRRCLRCAGPLVDGLSGCQNALCSWPDLLLGSVRSIAPLTPAVGERLVRLKSGRFPLWASVFGRVLSGWLTANVDPRSVDLVVANPGWERPHMRLILEAAAQCDSDGQFVWDVKSEAVWKECASPRSAGRSCSWVSKKRAAEAHAAALGVDARRVGGKRILVIDDVVTTGLQLEFVARRLLRAGASSVDAITLFRA